MKSRTKIVKIIHSNLINFYLYYHNKKITSISADVEFVDGTQSERLFASERFTSDVKNIESLIYLMVSTLNSSLEIPIFSYNDLEEIIYDLKNCTQFYDFEVILNYYFDRQNGLVYKEHAKKLRTKNFRKLEQTEVNLIKKWDAEIQKYV